MSNINSNSKLSNITNTNSTNQEESQSSSNVTHSNTGTPKVKKTEYLQIIQSIKTTSLTNKTVSLPPGENENLNPVHDLLSYTDNNPKLPSRAKQLVSNLLSEFFIDDVHSQSQKIQHYHNLLFTAFDAGFISPQYYPLLYLVFNLHGSYQSKYYYASCVTMGVISLNEGKVNHAIACFNERLNLISPYLSQEQLIQRIIGVIVGLDIIPQKIIPYLKSLGANITFLIQKHLKENSENLPSKAKKEVYRLLALLKKNHDPREKSEHIYRCLLNLTKLIDEKKLSANNFKLLHFIFALHPLKTQPYYASLIPMATLCLYEKNYDDAIQFFNEKIGMIRVGWTLEQKKQNIVRLILNFYQQDKKIPQKIRSYLEFLDPKYELKSKDYQKNQFRVGAHIDTDGESPPPWALSQW